MYFAFGTKKEEKIVFFLIFNTYFSNEMLLLFKFLNNFNLN